MSRLIIWHNDNDAGAIARLHHAMNNQFIPEGYIDSRSIEEIKADEIREFTQCHFFAGVGGWPYALRLAGWDPGRHVWTASLPCQPFSHAGKRRGTEDERHLWPIFRDLVGECRPGIIFGEQVASDDGRAWFSDVQSDFHRMGYVAAATDLCAASFGAPHIRQRLFWVAYATGQQSGQREGIGCNGPSAGRNKGAGEFEACSETGGLAYTYEQHGRTRAGRNDGQEINNCCGMVNTNGPGSQPGSEAAQGARHGNTAQPNGRMGDAIGPRLERHTGNGCGGHESRRDNPQQNRPAPEAGFWSDCEWIGDPKGRFRPIKPGICPLAYGIPPQVDTIRCYGNAIVPQVAAGFVETAVEWMNRK